MEQRIATWQHLSYFYFFPQALMRAPLSSCAPRSTVTLAAYPQVFLLQKYTPAHYVTSILLACVIRRDLTLICGSITVWPALYDCPPARAQFSTKRDFLLKCSSIVSVRGLSSSTLLHGVCSHSGSPSLQTVDTPKWRAECVDSAKCFDATQRRVQTTRVIGESY